MNAHHLMNAHHALTPDDQMPFGTYKGEFVWHVIDFDPEYVTWLLENTDVELDDEAYELYRKARP